jgi:hypothetical protein
MFFHQRDQVSHPCKRTGIKKIHTIAMKDSGVWKIFAHKFSEKQST